MIRRPAVAGQFYPGNAAELGNTVATLLAEAQRKATTAPKGLIVPHAGYVYSGPIAANAYAQLQPYAHQYHRVILLGPSHRTRLHGIAVPAAEIFRTPLGDVPVDRAAFDLPDIPGVVASDAAHAGEHSLEVQLPFLQAVLGDFRIIPLVVGDATAESVSRVLDLLWDGPETLIVISSDLSHYLAYDDARATDQLTCGAIENLDAARLTHDMACGATPAAGLLSDPQMQCPGDVRRRHCPARSAETSWPRSLSNLAASDRTNMTRSYSRRRRASVASSSSLRPSLCCLKWRDSSCALVSGVRRVRAALQSSSSVECASAETCEWFPRL